mgnify:CR=1 FL=1
MWALTQKRPIWKLSFFSICTPRIWLQWKGWNSFWKNFFCFYMVTFSWDIVSLFLTDSKRPASSRNQFIILFCKMKNWNCFFIYYIPPLFRGLVLKPLYSITGIFLTLMFSVFRIFTPSFQKMCCMQANKQHFYNINTFVTC